MLVAPGFTQKFCSLLLSYKTTLLPNRTLVILSKNTYNTRMKRVTLLMSYTDYSTFKSSNDNPIGKIKGDFTNELIAVPQKTKEIVEGLRCRLGVKERISWGLRRGMLPIPVVEAQDANKYPKSFRDMLGNWTLVKDKDGNLQPRFPGKNPSYMLNGKPKLVKHKEYQNFNVADDWDKTGELLKLWFDYPDIGIGFLGKKHADGSVSLFLDIDAKNFNSVQECEEIITAWIESYPVLKDAWIEMTQSGGYHIAVHVPVWAYDKDNINIAFLGTETHIGEVRGGGGFTVVSPTIGPSGNKYELIQEGEFALIDSLEAIGLTRAASDRTQQIPLPLNYNSELKIEKPIELDKFLRRGSSKAAKLLKGETPVGKGERSNALVIFIKELWGWLNVAEAYGFEFDGDSENLIQEVADNIGLSEDPDKVQRIVATISRHDCQPATLFNDKSGRTMWIRIWEDSREVYRACCPDEIKDDLRLSEKHNIVKRSDEFEGDRDDKNQGDDSGPTKSEPPKLLDEIADTFAEKHVDKMRWDIILKRNMRYSSDTGIWSAISEEEAALLVQNTFKTIGYYKTNTCYGYNPDHINKVLTLCKSTLAATAWDTRKDLIPMKNGVLDVATRTLMPYEPGYMFTWQLPYEYDPSATCEPVLEWLRFVTYGDEDMVLGLLCLMNAVVLNRVDLQIFAELTGPGGSGKSTYTEILSQLVGKRNTTTTEFEQLETNRFELAGVYRSRLLLLSDQNKWGGSAARLKQITGQDDLRLEQKNVQQGGGGEVKASCFPVIHGNQFTQFASNDSGLNRRRIPFSFSRQVPVEEQIPDFHIELAKYLPGLFNKILSIPRDTVTEVLKGGKTKSPGMLRAKVENILETNTLAAFVDDCLYLDPTGKTGIGRKDKQGSLYAVYCTYCDNIGRKAESEKTFSRNLRDLIESILKLDPNRVYIKRITAGTHALGLAVRPECVDAINKFSGKASKHPRIISELWIVEQGGTSLIEPLTPEKAEAARSSLEAVLNLTVPTPTVAAGGTVSGNGDNPPPPGSPLDPQPPSADSTDIPPSPAPQPAYADLRDKDAVTVEAAPSTSNTSATAEPPPPTEATTVETPAVDLNEVTPLAYFYERMEIPKANSTETSAQLSPPQVEVSDPLAALSRGMRKHIQKRNACVSSKDNPQWGNGQFKGFTPDNKFAEVLFVGDKKRRCLPITDLGPRIDPRIPF